MKGTIEPVMGPKDVHLPDRIGAALFGATRQAVLRLLLGHPDRRFYQRQIIKTAGLGSGTIQRELMQLTRAGVLTRSVEGRQVYFQANARCAVFEELRGLMRKTFGVSEILQAALESLAGRIQAAFIYGSVAKGTEHAGSDLDLMIIADGIALDDVVAALGGAQLELQREVNPVVYPVEEFCRKISKGHHFLSRVMAEKGKLFLIGNHVGLEELVKQRMAHGAREQPRGNRRSVRGRRPGS